MTPPPIPASPPELQELRHRYNRLCARFAETSGIDPLSAADTVQELQDLSDRIVAIEVQNERTSEVRANSGRTETTPSAGPIPSGDPIPLAGMGGSAHIAASKGANRRTGGPTADGRAAVRRAALADPLARFSVPGGWRNGSTGIGPAESRPKPEQSEGEHLGAKQPDFDQIYRAIRQQEEQIAAVLHRCETHQRQLEALERRLVEPHAADRLAPQLEAIAAGLEQQRQRITSLAVAIQRLLQWLATERRRSGQ